MYRSFIVTAAQAATPFGHSGHRNPQAIAEAKCILKQYAK
jgi:hypothetical protein